MVTISPTHLLTCPTRRHIYPTTSPDTHTCSTTTWLDTRPLRSPSPPPTGITGSGRRTNQKTISTTNNFSKEREICSTHARKIEGWWICHVTIVPITTTTLMNLTTSLSPPLRRRVTKGMNSWGPWVFTRTLRTMQIEVSWECKAQYSVSYYSTRGEGIREAWVQQGLGW